MVPLVLSLYCYQCSSQGYIWKALTEKGWTTWGRGSSGEQPVPGSWGDAHPALKQHMESPPGALVPTLDSMVLNFHVQSLVEF